MTAAFDSSPWGTHLPSSYERAVLALTRAMPDNWLGLRLAILLRRLAMGRIGEGCRDTMLWGMRLRLYPRRNGCEKNALFTPQMFDTMERRVLANGTDQGKNDFAHRNGIFAGLDVDVGDRRWPVVNEQLDQFLRFDAIAVKCSILAPHAAIGTVLAAIIGNLDDAAHKDAASEHLVSRSLGLLVQRREG